MATISYQLRAANVGNYGGGVVFVDNYRSFNVGAALTSGGGTITIDAADMPLVAALDGYAALLRSGSSDVGVAPATSRAGALVVSRQEPVGSTAGYVPALQSDGSWAATAPWSLAVSPRKMIADALRPDVRSTAERLDAGTVLTTQPTLTLGNGTTTIASSVLVAHGDSRFKYSTGPTVIVSNYRAARPAASVADTAQTTAGVYPFRVEFASDAPVLEIRTRPRTAGRWRMLIDGVPNVVQPAAWTITDDVDRLQKVDWSGVRKLRHYVLEFSGDGFFGGIRQMPADSLQAPTRRDGPRCLWVGDSYAVGISGTGNDPLLGYVPIAARMLGVEDFWQSCSAGGTGFLKQNTSATDNYDNRFSVDVAPFASSAEPLMVPVQGSINDVVGGYTTTQVAAAATAFLTKVKTTFPNAFIPVISPLLAADPATYPPGSLGPYSTALAAVAASLGLPYIDPAVRCRAQRRGSPAPAVQARPSVTETPTSTATPTTPTRRPRGTCTSAGRCTPRCRACSTARWSSASDGRRRILDPIRVEVLAHLARDVAGSRGARLRRGPPMTAYGEARIVRRQVHDLRCLVCVRALRRLKLVEEAPQSHERGAYA